MERGPLHMRSPEPASLKMRVEELRALQMRARFLGDVRSAPLLGRLVADLHPLRAFELRLPQVGSVQISALQPGRGEIDIPQVSLEQHGAFESAAAQGEGPGERFTAAFRTFADVETRQ